MSVRGTRLEPIVAAVAAAARRRQGRPAPELRSPRLGREAFVASLRGPGLAFIAEHKRQAPSAGRLCAGDALETIVRSYAAQGAAALSILTEAQFFGGSLADLARAAAVAPTLPRLRKDFLLDRAMVEESVAAGADAILLLAVLHPPTRLAELAAIAQDLDLAVLCEVHDERELEAAVAARPDAIGVNARDLRDFSIELERCERLLPQIPSEVVRVAESGLKSLDDLQRVRQAGAEAALVGTALMQHPHGLASWVEALA